MKNSDAIKRILAFAVVLCLILFTSCNKTEPTEKTTENTTSDTEDITNTPIYTGDVVENEGTSHTDSTSMYKETLSSVAVNRPEKALIQKEGIVQMIIKQQPEAGSVTYDIIRIYNAPDDNEDIKFVVDAFNELSWTEERTQAFGRECLYEILYNNGLWIRLRHSAGKYAHTLRIDSGNSTKYYDTYDIALTKISRNLP